MGNFFTIESVEKASDVLSLEDLRFLATYTPTKNIYFKEYPNPIFTEIKEKIYDFFSGNTDTQLINDTLQEIQDNAEQLIASRKDEDRNLELNATVQEVVLNERFKHLAINPKKDDAINIGAINGAIKPNLNATVQEAADVLSLKDLIFLDTYKPTKNKLFLSYPNPVFREIKEKIHKNFPGNTDPFMIQFILQPIQDNAEQLIISRRKLNDPPVREPKRNTPKERTRLRPKIRSTKRTI